MFVHGSLLAGLFALSNVVSVAAQTSSVCPSYDASKIKLVTFDCFAALMNWEDSMFETVAVAMPSLSSSQVNSLVLAWESAYGRAAGTVFDESVTGAFPFSWHVSTELKTILNDMGITATRDEFDALVKTWGELTPWKNTKETLQTLYAANYTIGVLSNGDRYTLSTAVSVFLPEVPFTYVFPSDFPAGAFKPAANIYQQAKQVGFEIEEILHVAGGDGDGSGARDAGLFSAVSHSSSRRRLFHDKVGGTEPCFVLYDISEVPGILGL